MESRFDTRQRESRIGGSEGAALLREGHTSACYPSALGCGAGSGVEQSPGRHASSGRAGKEDGPHGVLPKLSQEMLADMIGTTRPRVNFFMNKFRKLGFIQYNGGLQINTSLLSVVLHE
jgi:hypothetical protein